MDSVIMWSVGTDGIARGVDPTPLGVAWCVCIMSVCLVVSTAIHGVYFYYSVYLRLM